MTPQEIVSHEDFVPLIKAATKYLKIYSIIELDELIQEIAVNILKDKNLPSNLSLSTIVYKYTYWTFCRLTRKKIHKEKTNRDFSSLEKKEEENFIEDLCKLFKKCNETQIKIIDELLSGKTKTEVTNQLQITRSILYSELKDLQ